MFLSPWTHTKLFLPLQGLYTHFFLCLECLLLLCIWLTPYQSVLSLNVTSPRRHPNHFCNQVSHVHSLWQCFHFYICFLFIICLATLSISEQNDTFYFSVTLLMRGAFHFSDPLPINESLYLAIIKTCITSKSGIQITFSSHKLSSSPVQISPLKSINSSQLNS